MPGSPRLPAYPAPLARLRLPLLPHVPWLLACWLWQMMLVRRIASAAAAASGPTAAGAATSALGHVRVLDLSRVLAGTPAGIRARHALGLNPRTTLSHGGGGGGTQARGRRSSWLVRCLGLNEGAHTAARSLNMARLGLGAVVARTDVDLGAEVIKVEHPHGGDDTR